MAPIKILYIEHSKKTVGFKAAMESANAQVDLLPYPEENKLKRMLKEKHYDLVVTDAYFLRENVEHNYDNEEDGEYLLGKVIKIVRNIDNKRIKIAVHTFFSNPLLQNSDKVADLDHVDYIWDKRVSSDNLTYWQVKRIHEEIDKKFPEHTLVDSLILLLSTHKNLPFSDELNNILNIYRRKAGEVEQIESVKTDLSKIAQKFGFHKQFRDLFEFITKAEPLNVAGNPSAWGHLRHVLNVYWLGYFFLNSGVINIESTYDQIFSENDKESLDIDDKSKTINFIWFLSSLFHDLGLPAERVVKISEGSIELLKVYPGIALAIKQTPDVHSIYANFQDDLDKIFSSTTGKLNVWVHGCIRKLNEENKLDHGLVSGVTLFRSLSGKDKQIVDKSSECVSFHNLVNKYSNHNSSGVSFNKNPLACLLILCDQLEVWDRETGLGGYFSGQPIESYELRKLSYNTAENRFDLEINYIPYRFISPVGDEIDKIRDSLYVFLTEHVEPVLDLINFKEVFSVDIQIAYFLDGRIDIWKWDTMINNRKAK